MTRGYLLDTNIIRYWYDERAKPEHARVVSHVGALESTDLLRTSVIVLGEIEYGHRKESPQAMTPIQAPFRRFVAKKLGTAYEICESTTMDYARLRARLFKEFARNRRVKRPIDLFDPLTCLTKRVQENDLWIAAQAIEHNMVLVTHDQKMVRAITPVLGGDLALSIEDWAV